MPENRTSEKFNWFLLILLSMAQFMVVLDFSIVNVALPVIQKKFAFTQENLQWIITAYALTFGGFLLLGGRLADLYGRKKLLTIGLILFSIISFIGGISSSQLMLIIARAIQGIGAALILPASLSLITTNFREKRQRQKAISVFGAVGSSGFAAGAVLGGVLTSLLGWEYTFFVNVPIGFLTAVLAIIGIKEARKQRHVELDIKGALSVTSGLAVFIYSVSSAGRFGLLSVWTIIPGILSLLLIAAFLYIEAKSSHPLVPLSIFKRPSLRGANISVCISQAAFAASFLLLAEYLQDVLKYPVLLSGLMFLPMGIIVFIMSSWLAPKLMDQFGLKKVVAGGLAIAAIGFLLLLGLPVHGSYFFDVLPGIALTALGFGTSFPGLLIAAVEGVEESKQGLASGLINTSRQIGASVGVAILVSIVQANSNSTVPAADINAFVKGLQYAMFAGFVLMLISSGSGSIFIKENKEDT